MLIRSDERDAYLKFIEVNTALWGIEDRALEVTSDGIILVDMLSHDLHQVIRALYAGKIIQRHLRCRVAGLVGNLIFSRDLGFEYDKAEAIRIGRSYGLDEFIDLETTSDFSAAANVQVSPSEILSAAAATSDADLVDFVLDWQTQDGCRIGSYIYDTVLRVTRNPFLTNSRAKLDEITVEAYRIHAILSNLCRHRKIESFTAGHVSYTQWGITAEVILRNGGRCLTFDSNGHFAAYLLTHPPERDETISGMLRKIDHDLFEREFLQTGRLQQALIDKVQGLFTSEYFLRPYWFEPTRSPPLPLVPALRRTGLSKLGWSDASEPVICVFIHCLSDLPRDDEQIYLDYYVWVHETLQIAKADRSRRWIFKTHPYNRGLYDVTNATERLKADAAGYDHIFFLEEELEKVEVFAVCDLAVTVRGSIAYEMSMFGKPAVLAGRSALSDLGFCYLARSEAEYRTLLSSDIRRLALTLEMKQRARFYLIYDKVIGRLESTLMPYWTYQLTGNASVWYALCERILYNISDLDPMASAIAAMLDGGPARTINPRYRDLPQQEGSNPSRLDVPAEVPRGLLRFRTGSSALRSLMNKATRTEEDGSWFAAGREALVGFTLSSSTHSLKVWCASQDRLETLHITANGGTVVQLPLQTDGTMVTLASLGLQAQDLANGTALRIWATGSGDAKVQFRLDGIEIHEAEPEIVVGAPPGVRGGNGLMGRVLRRFGSQI